MLVIEKFENCIAICEKEDKTVVKVPKYRLPLQCKEGDCIDLDKNNMYVIVDKDSIKKKKERHNFLKSTVNKRVSKCN